MQELVLRFLAAPAAQKPAGEKSEKEHSKEDGDTAASEVPAALFARFKETREKDLMDESAEPFRRVWDEYDVLTSAFQHSTDELLRALRNTSLVSADKVVSAREKALRASKVHVTGLVIGDLRVKQATELL